jgi:uncharacterized protein YegJ (DUF2314 family)
MLWAMTGRVIHRWHLASGVERNRKYPESFWIPDDEEKQAITPGMNVQLIFEVKDGWGERMWVTVEAVDGRRLVGTLFNQPVGIPRLSSGRKIKFTRDDIINICLDEDHGHPVIDGELLGETPE